MHQLWLSLSAQPLLRYVNLITDSWLESFLSHRYPADSADTVQRTYRAVAFDW